MQGTQIRVWTQEADFLSIYDQCKTDQDQLEKLSVPMRRCRIDKCHSPWFESKDSEGPVDRDEKFSVGSLLVYLMLVYKADGLGRFEGSLRDLYKDYPGGCPKDDGAVDELVSRLRQLFERTPDMNDDYLIRPSEKTPDLDRITTTTKLYLRVIKMGENSMRQFFYIKGDALLTLMENTDRRCVGPMFTTYIYLISNMFTVKYYNAEGEYVSGRYSSVATHKKLCDVLNIEEKTLTRYLVKLKELGLIGYVPGEYGRDSVYTDGNITELVQMALNKQAAFYMKRYGGAKAKYQASYHSRRGPC